MKQRTFVLISLLCFTLSVKAQRQTVTADLPAGKKILVAYFSCSGTTERVADAIAKAVDGKLYRITPATAYTSADLDWNNKKSRSTVEMTTDNSRPELGGEQIDMKDYDIIFLGYPIWWNLCPRPVNTFLEKYDFSGKRVIPFATSGGSTIGNSVRHLKQLYPKIVWEEGKLFNEGGGKAAEWSQQIIARQ